MSVSVCVWFTLSIMCLVRMFSVGMHKLYYKNQKKEVNADALMANHPLPFIPEMPEWFNICKSKKCNTSHEQN